MTEPLGKVDQEEIKLRLTRGQDFQQVITPPEYETFPPGTTARIDTILRIQGYANSGLGGNPTIPDDPASQLTVIPV